MPDTVKLYFWPCGTWCNEDELEEYSFMSDDYATVTVPIELDDGDIDDVIKNINL